ncbi:hypothetical protein [Pseudomonas sp. NPDC089569]|uniref:hypothetical protein n=1 Tax=Pseudomonas sp. NPDC089569 TaxID=3390722 RepID=UPI003D04D7F4
MATAPFTHPHLQASLAPNLDLPARVVKGYFKVWENGLGCESYVSLAVVNDMGALLVKVQEGQAIVAQHQLKAIRMDYHPDEWIGSEGQADLQGLVITESTFAFVHTGFIGTEELNTEKVIRDITEIQSLKGSLYAPEIDEEMLSDMLTDG